MYVSITNQFHNVVEIISKNINNNNNNNNNENISQQSNSNYNTKNTVLNNFKLLTDIPTMITLNSSVLSSSAYSYFDRNSYSSSGLSIDEVLMIAKQSGEEKNVSPRINYFFCFITIF
jgi:hypothetical protein